MQYEFVSNGGAHFRTFGIGPPYKSLSDGNFGFRRNGIAVIIGSASAAAVNGKRVRVENIFSVNFNIAVSDGNVTTCRLCQIFVEIPTAEMVMLDIIGRCIGGEPLSAYKSFRYRVGTGVVVKVERHGDIVSRSTDVIRHGIKYVFENRHRIDVFGYFERIKHTFGNAFAVEFPVGEDFTGFGVLRL